MHYLQRDDEPEPQVSRLQRALIAVTRCGRALVHASDENHLIQQICNIIVQAGFHFAWVGFAEQDDEKNVRPLAWAGHEQGYLSNIRIAWSGRGPAGNAIRTGQPQVIGDIATDATFGPWHKEAEKRGYRSLCVVPLPVAGAPFGCLCVYADEPRAFDSHEVELFTTLAETLSYGIAALRIQKDRSEVEERLRRAEEIAYQAAQAANVGTWDWNAQTNEVRWSDTTRTLFGVPEGQEITYELCISKVHPDDREHLEQAVKKSFDDKTDFSVDARVIHQSGDVRWMAVRGKVLFDAENKPVRMSGITADTTEQRKSALERQKLVAVVQNNPDFVGISALDGQVLFINRAGQEMVGLTSEAQVTSSQIWDYFSLEDGGRFSREILPVILAGKPWQGEISLKHFVTNESLPVDMRAFAIMDEQGRVIGLANISHDITQRKRAEQAVRQSEERFRQLVAHIHDALITDDAAGRVTFANDKFLEVFGFRREQLPEITLEDCAAPEWREQLRQRHQRRLLGEDEPTHYECEGIRQDGQRLWLEVEVIPRMDPSGQIIGTQSIIRDITGRRQAEKALRESEDRYRDLVEHSHDLICTHDLEGKILSANAAATEFTGHSEGDLLTMNLRDLLVPEFRHQFENYMAEMQAKGVATGLMLVQTKKGERRVWEYANSLRTRDHAAPIVRGMARDITEQRKSEVALREAEEKYRTIFEEAVVGIFQTTRSGTFLNVNPELARMVGYSTPEELMAEVSDVGSQAYVDPSQRVQLQRLLDETGLVRDFEFQVYHRDGSKVWLSQNARVVRNAKGEALYYEGTVEDITERKGLEEQLRQSQRLDAIGKLAGGVAHDFNNLLGVIIGYCDILRGKMNDDDPLLSDVGHVRKAADSAATLTRQLLAFSRKQVFQSKVIDLNKIIRDLSKILQRVIGDDVELSIKAGTRLESVKADPGQIEQVIMNLAVNARDAMPYGGRLAVETSNAELDEAFVREHPPMRPGCYVLLKVSDSGSGMNAGTLSHIFEPFFTTKEAGKGVGLGLSIVYGIVKQSGGYIWASSEPGKGTTMEIYLPATSDPREQMTQVQKPVHVGGSETILLVEDEPDLCEMASMVLRNDGYDVLSARSGEEAIRIVAAQGKLIHLLLTDVVLKGGMSGIDLSERVQASCPGVKVLYMSGYSSDLVTNSGVPSGESELLSKPFSVDALRLKVRAVIDAPDSSQSKSDGA